MVSYVLLIVIAVVLSGLIYAYLGLYVPNEKPECPDGINIIVKDTTCQGQQLTLNLQNRGRFKISAVYIRLGNVSREYRPWLNDPNNNNVTYEDFYPYNEALEEAGLFPDEIDEFGPFHIESIITSDSKYELEIQPAVYTGKAKSPEDLALCPPITQLIDCTI